MKIICIVDRHGNVKITVEGVKGAACLASTEALEKHLGTVVKRENTSEMYEPDGDQSVVIKN